MEKWILKVSELRGGNLVLYSDKCVTTVPTVIHIGISDMVLLAMGDKDVSYIPIALTDEWLLRMGGRKINQIDWEISIGGIKFNCRFNKKWYSSIGGIYLSDKIQYVHSLQNLVHALTNEELTIKEK